MSESVFLPADAHTFIWDVATLTWIKWDGSLTTGAVTIGGVTQVGFWDIRNVTGTVSLPTLASTSTLQTTGNTSLSSIDTKMNSLVGFDIPEYDYISLAYTGDNLTTVVYKVGGSGGTTLATLTLAYTGAVLNSVTKT